METIVVGTDFSVPATNAVNYAVGLAKFFNARLILVHGISLPMSGYDSLAPLDMIAILQEDSINQLNELKKDILRKNYDFGIVCISEIGSSSGVIEDVATRYSADLVVMGMVGEGRFVKKNLIGSSAVRTARDLSNPVFIVPEGVSYRRIRHTSFACTFDQIEETTILNVAKYFAIVFDADIELVTVENKKHDYVEHNNNEVYACIEKRLQNTKHKSVYIKDQKTSRALEYYFKFHKTDLIMINPKKHDIFQTLFSESVTKSLAFNVEVPLLILH